MKPPIRAETGPIAADGDTEIPIPVTMMGSMFTVSESRIRTVSTLAMMVALAPSDPGDLAVDGAPVKRTVVPEPAWSLIVSSNDPGPLAYAATLASLNDSTSVSGDDPPWRIAPIPVTVTLENAGAGDAEGSVTGDGGVVPQPASDPARPTAASHTARRRVCTGATMI